MIEMVNIQGAKATVRQFSFKFSAIAVLAVAAAFAFTACGPSTTNDPNNPTGGDTAATVNGKAIKMEEVERVIKAQTQGQQSKLSPLELTQTRLQVLEQLIQQEVMYQKASKENTVPTDEEVTQELNKLKTTAGSAEDFEKKMKDAGETEQSLRESIKKSLAIQKLNDKITSKVEPPKDSEITAFYSGNKEAFVKKKGVKLAAIVIDPANTGEGDKTTDQVSAVAAGNEILNQLRQGMDFAALAREKSEDQSKFQGGDLGYVSEEQMRQTFPANVAQTLMDPNFKVGQMIPAQMQGKFYIFKLQERSDRDEELTLESPGVRQRVADELINARKQLLSQAFMAIAIDEAKIENNLAKQVIDNPNTLSGARPAPSEGQSTPATSPTATTPAAGNTNSAVPANTANTGAANSNTKPAAGNTNANTKK